MKQSSSFAEAVGAAFGGPLAAAGFEAVKPLRWVRARNFPIREILELQAMKGGFYSARWGFGLDFVPLYRGGKFTAKRTSKAAALDLCIDPVDEAGDVPSWCSFAHVPGGREARKAEVAAAATASRRAALTDFDKVGTLAAFVACLAERATRRFKRFAPGDYTQTHLAWGLALLALGQTAEGQRHLATFCQIHEADPADPALAEAQRAAVQSRG